MIKIDISNTGLTILEQNKMNKYSIKYLMCNNLGVVMLLLLILTFLIRYFLANAQIIPTMVFSTSKLQKASASGNLQSVTDYGFFNLYSFLIALFQTVFT